MALRPVRRKPGHGGSGRRSRSCLSPPPPPAAHRADNDTRHAFLGEWHTKKTAGPAPGHALRCFSSPAAFAPSKRAQKAPPPPINTGMAAWQGGMQFHWAYLGPSANEHCASAVMQHGQGAQWRTSSASRVQGHSDQGASAHQRRETRGTISLLLRAADGRALGCLAGHYWSCWGVGARLQPVSDLIKTPHPYCAARQVAGREIYPTPSCGCGWLWGKQAPPDGLSQPALSIHHAPHPHEPTRPHAPLRGAPSCLPRWFPLQVS
jgi:hypothetical protein